MSNNRLKKGDRKTYAALPKPCRPNQSLARSSATASRRPTHQATHTCTACACTARVTQTRALRPRYNHTPGRFFTRAIGAHARPTDATHSPGTTGPRAQTPARAPHRPAAPRTRAHHVAHHSPKTTVRDAIVCDRASATVRARRGSAQWLHPTDWAGEGAPPPLAPTPLPHARGHGATCRPRSASKNTARIGVYLVEWGSLLKMDMGPPMKYCWNCILRNSKDSKRQAKEKARVLVGSEQGGRWEWHGVGMAWAWRAGTGVHVGR